MPATYTLRGQITDAKTGLPVRNALVKIVGGTSPNFGREAVTNRFGRYRIPGLQPERIIVEATLRYEPTQQMKNLTGDAMVNLALTKE